MNIKKMCKTLYKYLTNADYRFIINSGMGFYNRVPDEEYLKKKYRAVTGKELHLENPQTFNEKLQWLKLHDRKPLYTQLVDKYAVRSYVAEKIGEEYLIPLVGGPWNTAEEIDFEALPQEFVLKCNHDSGGVVVCRDKNHLNQQAARRKLKHTLSVNYYMGNREWPYKNVKPCIIAEKFMTDDTQKQGLIDYKFFCFNGEAKFMYVSQGLEDHSTAHISFYDLEGKEMPFKRSDFASFDSLPYKPEKLDKMIELSDCLAHSVGSAFLRVDMYYIEGKIYFSEFTFTPCSGMLPFDPPEWDEKIGSWLTLPEKTSDID